MTRESGERSTARSTFIATKEYKRFAEFCDACSRYQYIGICYGPAGVGKTVSAEHYTGWDLLRPFFDSYRPCKPRPPSIPAHEVAKCCAILYTPAVACSPNRVQRDVHNLHTYLHFAVNEAVVATAADETDDPWGNITDPWRLMLVDEADRLKMTALEQVRDVFDRHEIGVVLIGMPGLEKRLSRYAQLYSRVGFVHEYRPLSVSEVRFILKHQWGHLGFGTDPEDFTDEEAVSALIRITGGNFRLLYRMMAQIQRVIEINELHTVTKEVVDTARKNLVIGVV